MRAAAKQARAAPPPADALRNDLDRLAKRIIDRALDHEESEPELEMQVQALRVCSGYWGTTRKGAGASSDEGYESAYTGYREMLETDRKLGKPKVKANGATDKIAASR